MTDTSKNRPAPARWLLGLSALVVFSAAAWGLKGGALGLAHSVGYAVCHQITVRTYVFGDLVMPLCARCSGQYLGALAGFFMAWRWGKLRASGLPPRWIIMLLVSFLAVWAFDGVNSYIFLITQRPFLYQPQNILRLTTGAMQGLSISIFFLTFFNQVFWRQPNPAPVLKNGREMAQLLWVSLFLVIAVHSQWSPLFYPLAFLSAFGVFLLLSMVGMLVAVILLRAENTAVSIRDFWLFFIPGMAIATLIIVGVDVLRAYAEAHLGFYLPNG